MGIFAALVNNVSDVFSCNQVAELGSYIFLLMTLLILVKSFEDARILACDTANDMVLFHKLLIPTYLIAVGAANGLVTMQAYEGLILLCIYGVERFLVGVIIPLIHTYFLLSVLGSVWKEERFTAMLELFGKGIGWAQKTILGVVSGLSILQSILTPAVDAARTNAVQRILRLIPGTGNLAEGTLSLLSGSALMIKNCVGVGLLLALLFMCAVPLFKLFLTAFALKCGAAVMGLFSDRTLQRLVDRCGETQMMLLKTVGYGLIFFVIALATVVATGRVV